MFFSDEENEGAVGGGGDPISNAISIADSLHHNKRNEKGMNWDYIV